MRSISERTSRPVRTVRRLGMLGVVSAVATAGLIGCDQLPQDPSPQLSHGSSGVATAKALLHAVNGSGVIAQVEIADDGAELTVSGHAYNLDPAGTYLSLFYGIGSFPGGPNACLPAPDPANLLTAGEMFVGFWNVDADGMGDLGPLVKSGEGSYVPVDRISTISIRTGADFGLVVACGKVSVHPAGG